MNLLESMQVYVLIVDKGSLSAAAAAMDISATMAGKHLRALEARLGMQLLSRTTRRQHMTPFGEGYYARCKEILRLVDETDAQAQHHQLAPAGTLRISAPVIFGTHALVPALAEYMSRYPDVRVEATLTDRVVDLAEEGFEAALRIGTLAGSSELVARALTPYRLMMCASPAYLAEHGTPQRVDELAQRNCLTHSYFGHSLWSFTRKSDGAPVSVAVDGNVSANDAASLMGLARAGAGIAMLPTYLTAQLVHGGELVPLFPDFEPQVVGMYAVYTSRKHMPATLRTMLDFLARRFTEVPAWDLPLAA